MPHKLDHPFPFLLFIVLSKLMSSEGVLEGHTLDWGTGFWRDCPRPTQGLSYEEVHLTHLACVVSFLTLIFCFNSITLSFHSGHRMHFLSSMYSFYKRYPSLLLFVRMFAECVHMWKTSLASKTSSISLLHLVITPLVFLHYNHPVFFEY